MSVPHENPTPQEQQPDFCEEVHLQYLDDLRESSVTNMFAAGPYLVSEFGVTREESHAILKYWMRTFSERHPR